MTRTLFTIGYEGKTVEELLDQLNASGVKLLIDVRAVAASRRPGFSKTALAGALRERGIDYLHLRPLGTPKAGREAARKGRIALLLQLAFACLLLGFALSRSLPLSLAIAFFAGICIVGVIALYSSLVQLTTSDQMRGRVMSIFMLAFRGGMPLGNLIAGFVAEKWSISTALAVNGVILAMVALWFIVRGTKLDEAVEGV